MTQFTACKHLDYEGTYVQCEKRALYIEGKDAVIYWQRKTDPDLPTMVQFCKLKGRLNSPLACIGEKRKQCKLYEDHTHKVKL